MVPHVPVGDIAAPSVGELADGVGVALHLLHGHLAVLHRQQPILLGLVVVELGQQQLRLALQGRILRKSAQLLFELPLLRLVEEPPGVDAVADAEVYGDLGEQLHVGDAVAALPLADGLGGHVQRRGQSLLGQPPVIPQPADLLSHFHWFVLLGFDDYILPDPWAIFQRLVREATLPTVEWMISFVFAAFSFR